MTTDANSPGGNEDQTPAIEHTTSGGPDTADWSTSPNDPGPTAVEPVGQAVAPRDPASIIAFVLALLGAVLLAVPLAVVGMRRTRSGVRRGRGFALSAFGVSTAWLAAAVALSASGLLGTAAPTAPSDLVEAIGTPLVASPAPTASAATPSPSPTSKEKPLAKPKKVYWQSLKPGMCVKDAADSATKIPVVDCRAPHQLEVTARTKASGPNRWPGDEKIADLVEGKCRAAFERYVGVAYDESDLDLDFWTADEEGWSSGVRTLVCFVYDPLQESTTEALAGTAR